MPLQSAKTTTLHN